MITRAQPNYAAGVVDYDPHVLPVSAADFFDGWPTAPGQEQFVAALRGSYAVEMAVADGRVVGFVNAISDGVATAFIPWLEVTRPYRGRGIGSELVRRMLARPSTMYSVDLACDPDLVPL